MLLLLWIHPDANHTRPLSSRLSLSLPHIISPLPLSLSCVSGRWERQAADCSALCLLVVTAHADGQQWNV